MTCKIKSTYGLVNNMSELGQIICAHRNSQGCDIKLVSEQELRLDVDFMTDVELGNETVQSGKLIQYLHSLGLELHVFPRGLKVKVSPVYDYEL